MRTRHSFSGHLAITIAGAAVTCFGVLVFYQSFMPGALGRESYSISATRAHGTDLGVTMFRAGKDSRSLLVVGQAATLSVGVNNLRGDAAAHDTTLTISLPMELRAEQAEPAPDIT